MKKLFSSIFSWQCLAALLALLMVTTPFAIYNQLVDKGPSWLGLDVSWKMTLNYAFIKHWTWGKDLVYTYGPLASLSTRTGWGISRWAFMLFDAFLVVNFYFVFADFIKNNTNKLLAMAILICTLLVVNPCFGSDTSWVLLFFVIYWMMKTFYDQRPFFLAMLIVLTVLAFYIKMNTGLIAMVFLGGHFINLFVCKKITLVKLLICCVSFMVLLIASAVLLNVSIINYISGSLEIIKGYNDVMYLDEEHFHIEHNLYILFFALLLWFFYKLYWQIKEKKHSLIIYTIACILFIFLLQKQATLRNDVQHLYEYFSFAPLILLCGFTTVEKQKPHLKYLLVIILFALAFVSTNRSIAFSLGRRLSGPVTYIKQFREYNSNAYINQPDKRYIPQRVLNNIGNKTVDVFPWDGEYAMENKLNYRPRPVFQSYSVYTAALEKINYDYYVKQAPDMLIYNYDAIDNRYPFNDEGLVNLFILNNYTLIDSFTSNERLRMVLQRKNKTNPLQFTPLKKQEFSLKEPIAINQANFIKLEIQYNLAGRIKAFFGSPPHVQISYMREDGQWFTYKTSVELLKSGLFVKNLVADDSDYLCLLTDGH
ncbi:MAG: hypothetical protein JWR09_1023, partial [Mucilaginibacter sp.]|nr:hypothetical protein [Mucilaginibacter sp.]